MPGGVPVSESLLSLDLPDLDVPPVTVDIGGTLTEVKLVSLHGGGRWRFEGLSTPTHHLDLTPLIYGWQVAETQIDGRPYGQEVGWSRAWHYDDEQRKRLLIVVIQILAWRSEHPDGAGEPDGWTKAIPGDRRPGEET